MIEFADMTVRFENCSRGLTHELVRHRHASFAQESTRYVDESDFNVVVPPHKDEKEMYSNIDEGVLGLSAESALGSAEIAYHTLRKAGWKPEDARQVLPTAIKADIVIKANLREWRHIFHMRCDKFAHWEIRGVMCDLLSLCKERIPILFDDFKFISNGDVVYARKVMSVKKIAGFIDDYVSCGGELKDILSQYETLTKG